MFLSKAFSMFEMDIQKIFKMKYCKKLQEWWKDDLDRDCLSFNLCRNTESSIILTKRWRGNYKKEE